MALANIPVTIQLGGDTILALESYSVHASILEQPSRFSVRMGTGSTAASIADKYPPGTPFKYSIAGNLQASGYVDGHIFESTVGATEITILGRDALAPLQSVHVDAEISFSNLTYFELVSAALLACGLDPANLTVDPSVDAAARSGVTQTNAVPIKTSHGKLVSGGGTVTVSTVQTKIGESWYHFVRRHIDRIGLMLWAAADGKFILSAPAGNASPSYRILRRRGSPTDSVTVTRAALVNDTSRRHAVYEIFGRTGQTKFCRAKARGAYVDDEMFNRGALFQKRTLTLRDPHVANIEQAEFLASRKAAEERREGWQLHYTMAGHVVQAIQGAAFSVWTPNTIVDVQDDEYNIHGPHWIESCEYRRDNKTETVLRLMRPQDLTFGTDEED